MDVSSLEVSNFDKEIIKSRVRDSVLSSYKDTGKTLEKNLATEEFDTLKILFKNKDVTVQKAVKVIHLSFWTEKVMCVKSIIF